MKRSVEDVAETLRNARDRGRTCALLIGAGCSVTAGVPSGQGFVDEIKERWPRAYERAENKTYAQCMAELALGERRDLIKQFVDKARINWAHLAIAQLIKHGFVDRVLTTNFDLLVPRTCALVGVFPAVYDFAMSQQFKAEDVSDPSVFCLHGQSTGFVLMNTVKECMDQFARLAPVFQDVGRGRVWIVVGYSGDSDPVFEARPGNLWVTGGLSAGVE